jgi:hypothetical protein
MGNLLMIDLSNSMLSYWTKAAGTNSKFYVMRKSVSASRDLHEITA